MGIKLDISMETPLSDDNRDILADISVMVLASANRQKVAGQADETAQEEDELVEPMPCGDQRDDGHVCVHEGGHSGRHRYRPINGW